MNLKEELKKMVDELKEEAKRQGRRLNNEQIAQVMGLERSYFSTLLGDRGNVTQDHIDLLRSKQQLLLSDTTKQPDYKDKYIELLEKQLAHKDSLEKELQELRSLILSSRSRYDRTLKDVHAYLQTMYWRSMIHFSKTEKVDLELVMNDMDKHLAGLLDEA